MTKTSLVESMSISVKRKAKKQRHKMRERFDLALTSCDAPLIEGYAHAYQKLIRRQVGVGRFTRAGANTAIGQFRVLLRAAGVPGSGQKYPSSLPRLRRRRRFTDWRPWFDESGFLQRAVENGQIGETERGLLVGVGIRDLPSLKAAVAALTDWPGAQSPSRNYRHRSLEISNWEQHESPDDVRAGASVSKKFVGGVIDRHPPHDLKSFPSVMRMAPSQVAARDTGERGTCVAFAISDAIEFASTFMACGRLSPSEQFLHWATKKVEPAPDCNDDPTHFDAMQSAIDAHGFCSRTSLPYCPDFVVGNPGHNDYPTRPAPTPENEKEAAGRRALRGTSLRWAQLHSGAAATLYELLAARPRVVAVMLPMIAAEGTRDNWRFPVAFRNGVVSDFPLTSTVPLRRVGAHAVLVAGYMADQQASGGGWFVFKNCWGDTYGVRGVMNRFGPAPGWGVVSALYVDRFALRMWYL